jgi:hypothetical protein
MHRSSFSRSLIFAATAFAVAACSAVADRVVSAVYSAGYFLKALVLEAVELAGNKAASLRRAVVWFVWAKAFTLRIAKRQRPMVSSSWRMCPSI